MVHNEEYDEREGPLVSVTMLVYNHEKWLEKAIESVMMQQTDFKFNLIIGEDCSTDGSRRIVEKYKALYPNKIIALFNEKNLGMKGNAENVWSHALGKYVACCEGDDYWTDSYKLKKQVDFLESHPEYSAIYHSSYIVDGNGSPMDFPMGGFVYYKDSDLSWELAAKMELPGQAASSLVRNPKYFADKNLLEINSRLQVLHGDHTGALLYMSYGKIRRCHEPVSAYRRTYEGSSFNAMSLGRDMHYYYYVGLLESERYLNMFSPIHFDNRKLAYGYLYDFMKKIFDSQSGKVENILIMFRYNPRLFTIFLLRILLIQIIPKKIIKCLIVCLKEVGGEVSFSKLDYAIFGTGIVGEQCIDFIREIGWETQIKSIWDNNEEKQGEEWHGLTVLAPGQSIEKCNSIIIASRKFVSEMKEQVQTMNGINIIDVKEFDDWVDDIINQASAYSWKLKIINWLFRYDKKWYREIRL